MVVNTQLTIITRAITRGHLTRSALSCDLFNLTDVTASVYIVITGNMIEHKLWQVNILCLIMDYSVVLRVELQINVMQSSLLL